MNALSQRVAVRYLLSRAQLEPPLKHIEKLVQNENWKEALDALFQFGKALGVFFAGQSIRISTEWLGGLDTKDRERFIDFCKTLRNVWEEVYPRTIGEHVYPFEPIWMDHQFQNMIEDLPWIQEIMRDESDAVKHGNFLIIPMKGVHNIQEPIGVLDAASHHVAPKFPKVLYGKVYIRKDLRPSGTYEARPGEGSSIAGTYTASTDTMVISMYTLPNRNSVHTIIHEFGHRYHTRFLKGENRSRFIQLFTVGDVKERRYTLAEREGFAGEYIDRSRTFRTDIHHGPIHLSKEAQEYFEGVPRNELKKATHLSMAFHDGDDSVIPAWKAILAQAQYGGSYVTSNADRVSPVYASDYGQTSWEENFAEAFLAYCTGTHLPEALKEFMGSL